MLVSWYQQPVSFILLVMWIELLKVVNMIGSLLVRKAQKEIHAQSIIGKKLCAKA